MKTIALVQSCYIPWKGYFDLINSVDEFIVYDECQYTRQDWRNRNRIKTITGTRWLTVPVTIDGLYTQRIDETRVADPSWAAKHWDTIRQAYRKAPRFQEYAGDIERAYAACESEVLLSRINRRLLEVVCELLAIETPLRWSTEYAGSGSKTRRIVDVCIQAGATRYVSGPRARAYLDPSIFEASGIDLTYFDYDGYAEYEQLHPPFEHDVTILDLLFNAGSDSRRFMKSFSVEAVRG